MVTSPTWFLAGEAGPERATFTPGGNVASSMGAGGSINIGPINIYGVNDPVQLARIVGNEIIREIRGRGQLNFLRAS